MRPSHAPFGTAAGTPARRAAEEIVAVDAPELFARYESSPEGLSGEEAHRRLRRYGPNELPSPRPPHPLRLLFTPGRHTLAPLLCGGGGGPPAHPRAGGGGGGGRPPGGRGRPASRLQHSDRRV